MQVCILLYRHSKIFCRHERRGHRFRLKAWPIPGASHDSQNCHIRTTHSTTHSLVVPRTASCSTASLFETTMSKPRQPKLLFRTLFKKLAKRKPQTSSNSGLVQQQPEPSRTSTPNPTCDPALPLVPLPDRSDHSEDDHKLVAPPEESQSTSPVRSSSTMDITSKNQSINAHKTVTPSESANTAEISSSISGVRVFNVFTGVK